MAERKAGERTAAEVTVAPHPQLVAARRKCVVVAELLGLEAVGWGWW